MVFSRTLMNVSHSIAMWLKACDELIVGVGVGVVGDVVVVVGVFVFVVGVVFVVGGDDSLRLEDGVIDASQ